MTPDRRLKETHDTLLCLLQTVWLDRYNFLRNHTQFEECYCYLGYCRQVHHVHDVLGSFRHPPKMVRILYVKGEREMLMVRKRLGNTIAKVRLCSKTILVDCCAIGSLACKANKSSSVAESARRHDRIRYKPYPASARCIFVLCL